MHRNDCYPTLQGFEKKLVCATGLSCIPESRKYKERFLGETGSCPPKKRLQYIIDANKIILAKADDFYHVVC